ncbi:Hypothetical protein PHPALM_20041 [Phytophthora palmivora]|uniref:Reverse transcriptase n=1 Tax=Phytophthora palmivora TaxID=4796 RepID=A0A2P4XFU9_9STRA|nr:Hypothetical protein PHPALM_20041 [Phytophthora palmivora]
MVYHAPLISDLLEDLDRILWYCSLDNASGGPEDPGNHYVATDSRSRLQYARGTPDPGVDKKLNITMAAQINRTKATCQWASLLSPWTLEIVKCVNGEDGILETIVASMTP